MPDIELTLKDGTPYIFTTEEQDKFLHLGESSEPPQEGTYARQVFDDMFTTRGINVPSAAEINEQSQSDNSIGSRPQYRTRESYFYEQAFLDSLDDSTIFSDFFSPDEQRRLNATSDLMLYRFMEQSQGTNQAQNAVDVDITAGVPALIGRDLSPQERAAFTAKKKSDDILEATAPYAHRLPLQVLANPNFQKLADPQTYSLLVAQYQAEHPRGSGFFSGFSDSWERSNVTSEAKRELFNHVYANAAADMLVEFGGDSFAGVADMLRPDGTAMTYDELKQLINTYDIAYGANDGFGSQMGAAVEGLTAPYRDWKGLGALALGTLIGKRAGFNAVNNTINAIDYAQVNAVDIALQAAELNPDLQSDGAFQETILNAAPEAGLGAALSFVETSVISDTLSRPVRGLIDKLKGSAATSPAINKAAGKMASDIENNAGKYKDATIKALTGQKSPLTSFAQSYATAVGVQSATTAAQGALTQEGANRLAGVEGKDPAQAGLDMVKENFPVILALSLVPAGLNALGTAVNNSQISQNLKEHSDRADMEAAASAAPIVEQNPAAAELLFSLSQGRVYRFSAYDLKKKYEELGLTPEQFRSQYELHKGDFDGLEELAESGGDIVISKAHWDSYYSPLIKQGRSEIYDFFNPFLRSGADRLSLDELRERLTPESMQRMTADLIAQINDENLTDALAEHIRKDITTKMQSAGVGKALDADYMSLLNANLFKNLEKITGVDGKALYDKYAASFAKDSDALNLSGRPLGTENITPEGGAYASDSGRIILGENASALTMFHEWGHYYLNTLERMASDDSLGPDVQARINQNLNDIKKALGYEPAHQIDERLQERFVAALIGSLVGDRRDLDPVSRERALRAKLAQERKGNKGKQASEPSAAAQEAAQLLFAPDLSRYNKTFFRLKRMIVSALYRNYETLKAQLDAENAKRENEYRTKLADYNRRKRAAEASGSEFTESSPVLERIDVAKELALQEYRERFESDGQTSDVSNLDVTHNMRDVITSHVFGEIAFQKHASLAGLHPVFDAAMLRDLDENLAKEAGDIASEIVDSNDRLRSDYVKINQLALSALRRGARGIEELKQEIIEHYFKEANQADITQDRINAYLDQVRKDTEKADLETNGPLHLTDPNNVALVDAAAKEVAANKASAFVNKVVQQTNKRNTSKRNDLERQTKKEFEAADRLSLTFAKANKLVNDANEKLEKGGLDQSGKEKLLASLNAALKALSKSYASAEKKILGRYKDNRQPLLFKAQWYQNGNKVQLDPNSPLVFSEHVQKLMVVDENGQPVLTQHDATKTNPAYSSPALDPQKLQSLSEQTAPIVTADNFGEFATPAQKATVDKIFDESYQKAKSSGSLSVDLGGGQTTSLRELAKQERTQRAQTYVETNRASLEAEARERLASEQNEKSLDNGGRLPADLKPLLDFLDKLKFIDEQASSNTRLREHEASKLAKNPAWHLLRYFNALPADSRLNFEEIQRVLGERIANILLRNGSAARGGSVTLELLGSGPAKMALGASGDKALDKYVKNGLKRLLSVKGLAVLGAANPQKLTDFAKGRIVATELAKMYSANPDRILDQAVKRELLTKSRATAIDTLNYNPNMVLLASKIFNTVGRKEIALLRKIQRAVSGRARAGNETDLKLLSDSIINRHSIASFDLVALQRIGGRARDKAQQLAPTMLKDQETLNQITELLTIDAVNKMAAHDGAQRLETLGKNVDQLKEFVGRSDDSLAKNYDLNHVMIMRVAASRMGITSRVQGERAEKALRDYAPSEVVQLLDQIEDDGRFSGDYKSMPIPQLESALETLTDLKDYSRRLAEKRTEQTAVDYASKVQSMVKEWEKTRQPESPLVTDGEAQSWGISPIASAKRWIASTARAYLLRVEQWCEIMDRGPNGITKAVIYDPVRKAFNTSVKERMEATKAFADVLQVFQKECTRKIIDAPELKTKDGSHIVFGRSKNFQNMGSWELAGFLMHIGNKSNFNKLLKGKGIEPADFQKFFDRGVKEGFITKPMMDALQKVWDANTEPFKLVQKAYYQIYGHYVKDIPSREIITPWGTYRGGYVPALADRDIAQRPFDMEGNLDTLMQGNVLKDYLGEPGFLKERVEGYTEPLNLDISVAMQSTLNVIHYSHMIEPVGRIYRMFESPSTNARALIDAYQPQFYERNIKPWLSRTLRDSASNNPMQGPAMAFLNMVANRVGLSYMFANLSNAMQGLTNFFVLAARVPPTLVVKSLVRSLVDYGGMRSDMLDQSLAMSNRFAAARNKSLAQIADVSRLKSYQNSIVGYGKLKHEQAKQFIQNNGYFLQTLVQQYIDVVSWHAAFEHAISQKKSNDAAIAYADSTVRDTQGSFDTIDVNNVEAGGPIVKIFTQFTSYFNTVLNLMWVELSRIFAGDLNRMQKAASAARVLSMAMLVPAIMSDWIAEAFKGNNVFTDSEDWQDFALKHMFLPTAKMGTAMIPIYGQGLNVVLSDVTGTPSYGGLIGTPATVGLFENTKELAGDLIQGKESKNAWRDGLTVLGVMTGIPIGTAVGRRIDYAESVDVDSFDEAFRLIFSGLKSSDETISTR